MPANDFDALLRSRFDEYRPEYNAAAWPALAEKLPPAPSPRRSYALWLPALGLAASIAAACILIFRQPAPQRQAAGLPATHSTHAIAIQSPISGNGLTTPAFIPVPEAITDKPSNHHRLRPIALLNEPVAPALTHPATTQQDLQLYAVPEDKALSSYSAPARPERHPDPEYPVVVTSMPAERPGGAKTTVSLAGGMQYGSLNAGYAAAIQVQRRLSRRWYAETEMGYQHYAASGASQLSAIDYHSIGSGGQGFGGADSTRAKLQPNQVIRYIQAAPGIGYRLSKAVSFGAGVDFQRALQSSDEQAVEVDGNDLKVLPLLDIGATARVSVRLSDWLEAGILYRQGVNNILQPGRFYLERQYLQVQVRVPLVRR